MRSDRLERDLATGAMHLLVLAHVARDGPIHGYGLIKAMEATTGRAYWKEGTVYPVLNGLEKDGILASSWNTQTGGAPRKQYQLTAAGERALAAGKNAWINLRDPLNDLLETP